MHLYPLCPVRCSPRALQLLLIENPRVFFSRVDSDFQPRKCEYLLRHAACYALDQRIILRVKATAPDRWREKTIGLSRVGGFSGTCSTSPIQSTQGYLHGGPLLEAQCHSMFYGCATVAASSPDAPNEEKARECTKLLAASEVATAASWTPLLPSSLD